MGMPVDLQVAERLVVVVGGGRIATRKIQQFLEQNALVRVVAPEATDQVERWAAEGLVTWRRQQVTEADLVDAWLIITATGEPAVDGWVFEFGEAQRTWVNSADDPTHCSVTLLSILRRGNLQVSVGTEGHAPAVATWVRKRIGEVIDPAYGQLVDVVSGLRAEIHTAKESTEQFDWAAALDDEVIRDIRADGPQAGAALLRARLGLD